MANAPVAKPIERYKVSTTAGFLQVLGWIGLAISLVLLFLQARGPSFVDRSDAIAAAASACGGALVLVALGALIERLDRLCFMVRQERLERRAEREDDEGGTNVRREPSVTGNARERRAPTM